MALTMENVPKCLGLLRHEWAPRAFHVSFKLETDEDLLISKAQKSIEAYGVHCVVANMLHTRTQQCVPFHSRFAVLVPLTVHHMPTPQARDSWLHLLCRVQLVYTTHGASDGAPVKIDTITRDGYDCVEQPLVQAIVNHHSQHS